MKIAIFLNKPSLHTDSRLDDLRSEFRNGGCEVYDLHSHMELEKGTDLILSVGGDGTFLSASRIAAQSDIPVIGTNLGRMGFLSENRLEDVASSILEGKCKVDERPLLEVSFSTEKPSFWPYALNEIAIHRTGPSILGINVAVDDVPLPTYWADGLIVATSSGSTAYSLSAGGPICLPETKVLLIVPIAPHNLNVRPLVVPVSARISLSVISRDGTASLSMDNRNMEISGDSRIDVKMAHFSLKKLRLEKINFVEALTSKLFWGEDVRNNAE